MPASPLQSVSDSLADIVARAGRSAVSLRAGRARASGFFWRPGLIVTAEEALPEDAEIAVSQGDTEAMATVVGRDPSTDIALLRTGAADRPHLALESVPVRAGALVLAVGARYGAPAAAFGAVSFASGPWRSVRGGMIDSRIELDLALRRTGEGCLALDASGRAFGMAVWGPRRRVLVIPSATIERIATQLVAHGRIARGYLGLALQPVRLDEGEGAGAMVMGVDAKGPGAPAGVRQGDIIVAWNGEPVRGLRSVIHALGPESVGTSVQLGLRRAGEAAEATLTIGERSAA